MSPVLSALGVAITVFAVTNIDDLLLLAAFFAAGPARPVVVGQLTGIAVLIAISVAATAASLVVPPAWIGLLGVIPLVIGIHALFRRRDPIPLVTDSPSFLTVAAVTIANGGDNLGAYVPLFAHSPHLVPVYAVTFMIMTVLWCALGHALVRNRLLGDRLRRSARILLPFILIAVGLMVLSASLALVR